MNRRYFFYQNAQISSNDNMSVYIYKYTFFHLGSLHADDDKIFRQYVNVNFNAKVFKQQQN
jgi:hypothetical protein